MSLEEHPSHPAVFAEEPSDLAKLRIFLTDPKGRRQPRLWVSDLGTAVDAPETIVARMLRWLRRR